MGLPYRHIACCMDDSAAAERALAQATALREAAGARLSLVHVGPFPLLVEEVDGETRVLPDDLNATAREWIGRVAAATGGAEAVFLEGLPAPTACRWAADAGVDLIVTAAHHGRLEGLLIGSFSEYVVRHAPCPVLVVREPRPLSGSEPPR
ncbi:universal stress protein [Miltoncostaea marina]|uniref:universal stress protein n=1 Tax=Miltoncostaea marina TaxID=2843215 RepID=UPI001C3DB8F6|nr:universal stress protein [Miltoncostaea marina]